MKNSLSHSFTFQTDSSTQQDTLYENILYLSEVNSSKYFVQYLQYSDDENTSIDVKHISIKVDRPYFLEMANICIDERERRRHFFSILGKRRFGASNKHFNCHLFYNSTDEKSLLKKYIAHYEYQEFKPIYKETTKYSTNKYRVYIEHLDDLHVIFLDQLNTTSRRKIHKVFYTDITNDELDLYNELVSPLHKIDYIFNKIGKNYFKSLKTINLQQTENYKTTKELALSMIILDSDTIERTSQIQDNTSFRKFQNINMQNQQVNTDLAKAALGLINNPSEESENIFILNLKKFIVNIEGISAFKEMEIQLKLLNELMLSHTVSYLLSKNDHDIQDIFMYTLESFSLWNTYLDEDKEDIRAFNSVTIDLTDSIRHFVEVCYEFKHDYKCKDLSQVPPEEIIIKSSTSAQSYFKDIDLDGEIYEELIELERDIDILSYAADYTEDITTTLINFFEGYTRVLNPLFEFKDLSYSLMLLTQKLSRYEIDEKSEMLLILMRGFISDLLEWKRSVLVEQTAQDIHFMDKSFYSNIAQIEIFLESSDLEDDNDGDMEFF